MSDVKPDNKTIDAIRASVGIQHADDGKPFVLVPEGYKVNDLDSFTRSPLITRQTVALQTIASFVAYVLRFKTSETSIFAPVQKYNTLLALMACIDYHGPKAPSHVGHRVNLTIPLSLQWERWMKINKVWITQTDFAEFLEQNVIDVLDPDAATIKEIVRSMEATKTGEFKSGVRLSNGSHSLMWSEEVQARAGAGNVEIPEKISIGIPIFKGDQPYTLSAFFRYRITDGKLRLQIELDRAEFLFDIVADNLIQKISDETTVPVYRGFI